MDIYYAKKLLDIYIENVRNILCAGFGVNHAETALFDVIRFLREEPLLKQYFLKRVESTFSMPDVGSLEVGMVPGDLIELVAHELRWPEFLELAKNRVKIFFHGDITLAAGDVSSSIRNAYSNEWADREFYLHYMQD